MIFIVVRKLLMGIAVNVNTVPINELKTFAAQILKGYSGKDNATI
jgi:hypothetical protein